MAEGGNKDLMGPAPWHEQGPYVVDKAMPDEICKDLLRYFRASPPRPRSYQGVVDLSKRHCDYVEVPSQENVFIDEIVANLSQRVIQRPYPHPDEPTAVDLPLFQGRGFRHSSRPGNWH